MTTQTLTWTDDGWIGATKVTWTDDGVPTKHQSLAWTDDGYLKKALSWTDDGFISEARGTMRGVGSLADRNALQALQPGDHFSVQDDPNGQHMHYWDGSNWSAQRRLQAQESGQARTQRTPNPSGAAAIQGDATYPFLLNAGGSRAFSVDGSGTVQANRMRWGDGNARLNFNGTMTLQDVVTYSTPLRVQTASTTVSAAGSISVAWPSPTTAGNFLYVTVTAASTSSTLGTPAGFTSLNSVANSQDILHGTFIRANCSAGEAAPVVTVVPNADMVMTIIEYSGIVTTSSNAALDRSASAFTGTGLSVPPNSYVDIPGPFGGAVLTTAQVVELLVASVGLTTGTQSTQTPGFAVVANTSVGALSLYVAEQISTGFLPIQFNLVNSGTADWAGRVAAFKAATTTISTPASKKAILYVADNSGVSAYWYRDDAGVDHLLADAASVAAAVAAALDTVNASLLAENDGLTDALGWYHARIAFIEEALGIRWGTGELYEPAEPTLLEPGDPDSLPPGPS